MGIQHTVDGGAIGFVTSLWDSPRQGGDGSLDWSRFTWPPSVEALVLSWTFDDLDVTETDVAAGSHVRPAAEQEGSAAATSM